MQKTHASKTKKKWNGSVNQQQSYYSSFRDACCNSTATLAACQVPLTILVTENRFVTQDAWTPRHWTLELWLEYACWLLFISQQSAWGEEITETSVLLNRSGIDANWSNNVGIDDHIIIRETTHMIGLQKGCRREHRTTFTKFLTLWSHETFDTFNCLDVSQTCT